MRPIAELTQADLDRFWVKVEKSTKPGGCWIWTSDRTADGYGRFQLQGGKVRAHRLSFTLANGPIPIGKVIDHVCRVRACVRPDHLRAITNQENVFAPGSVAPAKVLGSMTECIRGHLLAEPNLSMGQKRRGKRGCLACQRARSARYDALRRHGIHWTDGRLQQVADAYFAEIMTEVAA